MNIATKVVPPEHQAPEKKDFKLVAYRTFLDSLRSEMNDQQHSLAVRFGEMIERRTALGQDSFNAINYLHHLVSPNEQTQTPPHTLSGPQSTIPLEYIDVKVLLYKNT